MIRREMTEFEKLKRKQNGQIAKELQSQNICPTCHNFLYHNVYEDFTSRLFYENEYFYCFLEQYPRTPGHTIILLKEHAEDLSELPLSISDNLIQVIKATTLTLKEVLHSPKVYLCTMCDGKRNHLHFQLIPTEENSISGSKLFVKERGIYVQDNQIVENLRKKMKDIIDSFRR